MKIKVIGIDLAKNVFQLHGVDHHVHTVLQKRLSRGKFAEFMAQLIGNRDIATFQRLYAKVRPKDRHIIGKSHTVTIERDNSNTRHHLARMTRRTKVFPKRVKMIDAFRKLWCALTAPETFHQYQVTFLSIFM